jgi:hypothetical protein
MARLCPPGGHRREEDVGRMTREYVFSVLFCDRDKDGNPLIRPWGD